MANPQRRDSHGESTRKLLVACFVSLFLLAADGAHAGNIFLTGHDVDLHQGQHGFDTVVLDYLRGATCGLGTIARLDYKIAVVGSKLGPNTWRWSDGSYGVTAKPNFGPVTYYDTDDLIAGTVLWSDVLANDVLVILSHQSCSGCDLDAAGSAQINAHAADIVARFNDGMDIWANTSGSSSSYYDFLPAGFAASGAPISGSSQFAPTAAGAGIGLVSGMVNGSQTHNKFATFSSALTVMEVWNGSSPAATISLGACNIKINQVVDHLECYKVKDQGPKLVGIVDLDSKQFGLAEGCKIRKATKFCVPVTKSVVESSLTPVPFESQALEDDRICYKITCPKFTRTIDAADQFGNRRLASLKPFELCTPARKRPPGLLHVCKVHDLNGDGVRDIAEPSLPGWVISVSSTSPPFSASATTGTSGCVDFPGLLSGSYTVTETLQSGWVATGPTSKDVTLSPATGQAVFFLNRRPRPSQIYVIKFNDLNGDGVQDAGEPGIGGWPITVSGPNGTVDVTTTAGGFVDLYPLAAGSYVVAEQMMNGWSATGPTSQSVNLGEGVGFRVAFGNRCACTDVPGSICGDGVVSPCEECDDGGTLNGDGCNECCGSELTSSCGDGTVTTPEQCDPPGGFTCPFGGLCNPDCTCGSPMECAQSAPACNGACDVPWQVCVTTMIQKCTGCDRLCTTDADCISTGCGLCLATTDCACVDACALACVGGANAGAPCTTSADCPGGTACSRPDCCCSTGSPPCTNDAQCGGAPGSCQCP